MIVQFGSVSVRSVLGELGGALVNRQAFDCLTIKRGWCGADFHCHGKHFTQSRQSKC